MEKAREQEGTRLRGNERTEHNHYNYLTAMGSLPRRRKKRRGRGEGEDDDEKDEEEIEMVWWSRTRQRYRGRWKENIAM